MYRVKKSERLTRQKSVKKKKKQQLISVMFYIKKVLGISKHFTNKVTPSDNIRTFRTYGVKKSDRFYRRKVKPHFSKT